MATETSQVKDQLLNVLNSLQTPINENAPEPSFESETTNGLPPAGIVQMQKRSLIQTTKIDEPQILKSDNCESEATDSMKEQYYEAVRLASQLPKETRLETFNSFHQKCASYLIEAFFRVPCKDLPRAVEYAKKFVSPSLFNYALSVAILHRDDAVELNLQLPSHVFTDPGMYIDISQVTSNLKNSAVTETVPAGKNEVKNKNFVDIHYNYTGTNQDPEHKVAYFREDIGLNLHHRHWHEVYPFAAPEIIVKKDRRGELFYYMHQQIVARYNFERLCNDLPRAKPYSDFREPIEEAYFPKLDALSKASQFSSRPANTKLRDLHRENFYIKLSSLERWRDRIYDSIDRGHAYVIDKETGKETVKKIDDETGINELANSIEAVEKLSWNYQYYGDMHNKGHIFFSYVHDPDNRFREEGSVMSHSETALRDPIFYRWHVFIDEIFQHYKRRLPPYSLEQRQFKGINIKNVKIEPQQPPLPKADETQKHSSSHANNVIKTFMQKDAVDVTQGILNKNPDETKDEVYAVFTHLQHQDFEYVIVVTNDLPNTVTGTVRIFMAPISDETRLDMAFNGHRRLFIELDKFTHQLDPGQNTIKRKSTESSVTIPFEKSFMTITDVKKLADDEALNKSLNTALNGYCGCGWPHHLLIGKGTPEGFPCHLFVMITDYENDKVEESPLNQKCCDKSSLSYCGVRNKKYPDRKPMGFPFDRDIADGKATIYDFITEKQESSKEKNIRRHRNNETPRLSNMFLVPLRVRHEPGLPKCGKTMKDSGYLAQKFNNTNKTPA